MTSTVEDGRFETDWVAPVVDIFAAKVVGL